MIAAQFNWTNAQGGKKQEQICILYKIIKQVSYSLSSVLLTLMASAV